jgi:2-oxoisovalerate dehydrogenase E2 component (dihydrolipoyl transacylase)
VVRRLAGEYNVKIADVPGSGTGGRVTRRDIEGYIEQGGAEREAPTEQPAPRRVAAPEPERVAVYDGDRVQDLTGIRRAIANRMAASKREAPHAWSMVEVDMSGLVALREREKTAFVEREGVKLTYLPFIVKAVVESLRENPVLNSVWDGDRIILRKRINIGVAVDLEDALVVPVIPDADELNITGLTRRIDDLVKRARAGELGTEDVSGGTFTVNNPGSLGSVVSTPIINHPQAAILSAEAIVKRPVVLDDAIAIRSMMNLEVSFDHRVLDGGAALRFLGAVKERLQAYGPESSLG